MQRFFKVVALAGTILAGAWGVGHIGAQEEVKPVKSPRGGFLARAGNAQFEVFFYATGVRVFALDEAGASIDASRLTGTVTFYHPNSPKPWFSRPLAVAPGQATQSLDVAIGLSNAPATGARATFEVSGLSTSAGSKVTFAVPVEFVQAPREPVASQTRPPYYYGPGYSGYGYYPSAGASPSQSTGVAGGHLGHAPSYDWSVGRTNPLSKPWLRPWD